MGGGSEFDWMDVEDLEALAAYIFQLCDTVAYGIPLSKEKEALEEEYQKLDELLSSLGDSLPFIVAKTAEHVTAVQRMRMLASRYKDLEVATYGYLEGARRLADGFIGILLVPSPVLPTEGQELGLPIVPPKGLVEALRRNSPSVRQALTLAVQRMQHIAQLLLATSGAHQAVSCDMDLVVRRAGEVAADPTKSDIGLKAAPMIGAAAAGSLGLVLLRGALGPVAAVALGALGALGTKEIAETSVVPQVKVAFERMYDEASQVSSLIHSKASALEVIAKDLMATSSLLQKMLDLSSHQGAVSASDLTPAVEDLHAALSSLLLRSEACRQRLTAFQALTYTLAPKNGHCKWAKWAGGDYKAGDGKSL